MDFVDEVTLDVIAGDGGNGAVAFHRLRFQPKGGPAGGDGGGGGDVFVRADRNLGTLLDLRYKKKIIAQRGRNGGGSDCHGRGGEDEEIRVPVGTSIVDAEDGTLLHDLIADGDTFVVARGGRGGRGNIHFATSSNRAPRRAENGQPGEQRRIRFELRLLADVGIIGLPNVGKSTLVSRMSAARPKIADYPFTTLVPNLGVVQLGPGSSFVMADIPGLVRGASEGAGLGSRFLRHVQRTGVLLHLLALNAAEDNDLYLDFEDLNAELVNFDPKLASAPQVVAINKADLPATGEPAGQLIERLRQDGREVVLISAATGQGLDDLKQILVECLKERLSD